MSTGTSSVALQKEEAEQCGIVCMDELTIELDPDQSIPWIASDDDISFYIVEMQLHVWRFIASLSNETFTFIFCCFYCCQILVSCNVFKPKGLFGYKGNIIFKKKKNPVLVDMFTAGTGFSSCFILQIPSEWKKSIFFLNLKWKICLL